jgi:hypothetical protein
MHGVNRDWAIFDPSAGPCIYKENYTSIATKITTIRIIIIIAIAGIVIIMSIRI